ncbi:MAG: RidA family protein [Pseudomonadota bacterium]
MPLHEINPKSIAPPFSNYSHAIAVDPRMRMLFVSGQLGLNSQGVFVKGFRAQFEQAMLNLEAVLSEADMTTDNLVKLTVLSAVADDEAVRAYRDIRDERIMGHAPAALFSIVTAFTHPDILVEVEAVAAK